MLPHRIGAVLQKPNDEASNSPKILVGFSGILVRRSQHGQMRKTRVMRPTFGFVELHWIRVEQDYASRFGTRQVERSLQDVVHYVQDTRIGRAHDGQILFAQLIVNRAQAFREKWTTGPG